MTASPRRRIPLRVGPVARAFVAHVPLFGALLLSLLLLTVPVWAHGDEPHGDAAAPAVRDGASVASALSPAFEVVLVVPARAATSPLHGTLYLADFASNAPIAGATLTLTVPGRPDTLRVAATAEPGVYSVEGPALPTGAQSFALRVVAGEARGLLLLALPASTPAAADGASGSRSAAASDAPVPWAWFGLVAALGVGIALWLVRLARQRRRDRDVSPLPSP